MRRTGQDNTKRLQKVFDEIERAKLRVGFFESSKYPDGTPAAYVASIHEFGSPKNKIPPRSFMRPAINDGATKWARGIEIGCRAAVDGKTTIKNVLDLVGMDAAGHVRKNIAKLQSPALKQSTVKARIRKLAKGSKIAGAINKPLVETGYLLASVTSQVEL